MKLALRVIAHKQQTLNTRLQTHRHSLTDSQTLAYRLTETRLQTHRNSLTDSQTRMSSGKWQNINGSRYPVEDYGWEAPNENSFTHNGKDWDVVRELTLEEALTIEAKQQKDWTQATDEELMVGAFGEGIPGVVSHSTETIVVKLDAVKTQMPFGFAETAPLLELLWRKTGADCPGEEADLELPSGSYHILLQE